jgi:predicted RNA-binding protein with PIN domain/phage shock protein A
VTVHLLPPRVRTAVTALAADAVGRMPAAHVPAALRRSASFAPARRAKLVGRQIVEAVASDDEFREHLATQVRAMVPTIVVALESGEKVAGSELAQAAAVAYLVRTAGWEELVASANEAERREKGQAGDPVASVDRLAAQLEQARAGARQQRDKLRAQIDALKVDNAALRRTLGQTRTELKDAKAELARAGESLEDVRREAEVAAREAAAEARRLKARVTELEAESAATRRVARDDRDAEVIRLRLLIDTMVDTANGLRRELALPASSGLPADGVPTVEPGVGSAVSQVGRALLSNDPILLRRLLELPRVHLIVDGYNVSKEAWHSASLEQQRSRLVAGLAGLVSGKGIETTVVFDGADLLHTPVVPSPRGVRVRFSPPGITADEVIRQLVNAEPLGRPLVVVSTDQEVAETVSKLGARSVASVALVALLGR